MSLNNKNIVPFDKFMSDMLYDVKKGYYMNTNPFGKSGDFITAPNLSVMFSEMIAIWCLSFLKNQNLQKKIQHIKKQLKNGFPTIPSTIRDELDCNIFLRTKDLKTFSKLRDLKDNF